MKSNMMSCRHWFQWGFAVNLPLLGLAGIPGGSSLERGALHAPPSLQITNATLTPRWFEGSDHWQIIEMVVQNTDDSLVLTVGDKLDVAASGSLVDLVKGGAVKRLMPQQSTVVQVGVKNKANVGAGIQCSITVTATWGNPQRSTSAIVNGKCGFPNYTADATSVQSHQSPDWYNNAKYGIFIHWGIYAVPSYGGLNNEDYAEWYWYRQHDPNYKTHTYQWHQQNYGTNVVYDDFIKNFTASQFTAKVWMDLIHDSGARYFVPVTKHHDGFSIFKTPASSSNRNTVNFGPKRDFLKELFDYSKANYPDIRRGTYFSLPEWYHPEYKKYAITWGGGFPGGPPTNPYNNQQVPYTGYVKVNDFVQDLQLPQMKSLAYDYGTEIMWCDIGGANASPQFLSEWFNKARDQGRQVVYNQRCGLTGDFDTPEYWVIANPQARKWESNRGMDPFSFGYNHLTPDSKYLTGSDIVTTLVDIVSKNGNFLLDIGPRADGSIPDVMANALRDAGKWILAHAESIFDTRYWQVTAGKDPWRYTTTADAFYIHYNKQLPTGNIRIPDKVPFINGDKITILGGSMNGQTVPTTLDGDGFVIMKISSAMVQADKYVWTFKIAY